MASWAGGKREWTGDAQLLHRSEAGGSLAWVTMNSAPTHPGPGPDLLLTSLAWGPGGLGMEGPDPAPLRPPQPLGRLPLAAATDGRTLVLEEPPPYYLATPEIRALQGLTGRRSGRCRREPLSCLSSFWKLLSFSGSQSSLLQSSHRPMGSSRIRHRHPDPAWAAARPPVSTAVSVAAPSHTCVPVSPIKDKLMAPPGLTPSLVWN